MSLVKLAAAARCHEDPAVDLTLLMSGKDAAESSSQVLFSDQPQMESEVITGEYAGSLLSAYIDLAGREILGKDAENLKKLPLMARAVRSDGTHLYYSGPENTDAFLVVCEAAENASIYFGVKQSSTKEQLEAALKNGTWKEMLQPVPAQKGDVFQLDAGTIYAFDDGITMLEVKKVHESRPVDPGEVLESLNLEPIAHDYHHGEELVDGEGDRTLAGKNDVFELDLYTLDGRLKMDADARSFKVIVVLEGSVVVEKEDLVLHGIPWDTFFASAKTDDFTLTGNCRFALIHLVG